MSRATPSKRTRQPSPTPTATPSPNNLQMQEEDQDEASPAPDTVTQNDEAENGDEVNNEAVPNEDEAEIIDDSIEPWLFDLKRKAESGKKLDKKATEKFIEATRQKIEEAGADAIPTALIHIKSLEKSDIVDESKTLNASLFSFLSVLAKEMSSKASMSEVQQYDDLYKVFRSLIADPVIFEERDVYKHGILKEFDDHKLPRTFTIDYLDSMYKKNPPASFLKAHFKSAPVCAQSRTTYFGSLVKDAWNESQTYINNQINRLWIDPSLLPSGVTMEQWLLLMRIKLWEKIATDRAVAAVRKDFNKKKKEFNKKDPAIIKIIADAAKSRKFNPKYYHSGWLSFLYLGLPSRMMVDGGDVCESLKSGAATRDMNRHDAVVAQRKANRGAITEAGDKPDSSNKNNINVIVQIPQNQAQERRRDLLTKQVALSNQLALSNQCFVLSNRIFELQCKIDDPQSSTGIKVGAAVYKADLEKQLAVLKAQQDKISIAEVDDEDSDENE